MSETKCTTHHHACDCREEKIKRLVMAARHLDNLADIIHPACAVEPLVDALKEWEGEYE